MLNKLYNANTRENVSSHYNKSTYVYFHHPCDTGENEKMLHNGREEWVSYTSIYCPHCRDLEAP